MMSSTLTLRGDSLYVMAHLYDNEQATTIFVYDIAAEQARSAQRRAPKFPLGLKLLPRDELRSSYMAKLSADRVR